jgi:hypothetical protein
VIVANRNGGPAEQNADIRNLISAGANAIIINPSSPSALNATIAQAAARGIKVVSLDQRVTAPSAYNVTNDQVAYGRLGAEWLFKQIGGKGNVVEMRGIAGAYLFGSVTLAQFQAQAAGVAVASQLLAMLPYVATIVVLAIISRDAKTIRLNAPASLGRAYHPE